MVGMAMGLAAKGYIPFLATFAAFLTRAHDQLRMAAYSESSIKVCGSHVGVSIGEDGPSQMGLEDLAIFRAIPGCAVFYPGDAFAAEACVEEAARHRGMCYIRTSRPATPILYSKDETFPIGGSKLLRKGKADAALIVAAGVTLIEALKAYDALRKDGIEVRILDAYSVQPLDADGIRKAAAESGNKVVVVEDHYQGGGLGEAVGAALAGRVALEHLCIREIPRSGKPDELLDRYGISARHIIDAVRRMI
jgi:transketolase